MFIYHHYNAITSQKTIGQSFHSNGYKSDQNEQSKSTNTFCKFHKCHSCAQSKNANCTIQNVFPPGNSHSPGYVDPLINYVRSQCTLGIDNSQSSLIYPYVYSYVPHRYCISENFKHKTRRGFHIAKLHAVQVYQRWKQQQNHHHKLWC